MSRLLASTTQVSTLENQLSNEKQKSDALQQELHSMRQQLQQLAESDTRRYMEVTKELVEARAQWASEQLVWNNQRTSLLAQVDALQRSKTSTEKDREFFREQYAQASGFVSSVRNENKELAKQLKIAQGQATSGVGLVKATFEQRIKKLEADAKSWHDVAAFLIDKDRRTDGDEIRRRAGEQPELHARCLRQQHNLQVVGEKMEDLELELEQKEERYAAVKSELGQWQKETTRLHADLNEALIKLDRIGRAGDEASQGNGHEYVYRCLWRTDSGNTVCPEAFLTLRVSILLVFCLQ